MKQLLSHVTSGDLSSVEKYLTSLEEPVLASEDSVEEAPRSKRPRLDLTEESVTSKPPRDIDDLLQCAEHNSNILHLCCVISQESTC